MQIPLGDLCGVKKTESNTPVQPVVTKNGSFKRKHSFSLNGEVVTYLNNPKRARWNEDITPESEYVDIKEDMGLGQVDLPTEPLKKRPRKHNYNFNDKSNLFMEMNFPMPVRKLPQKCECKYRSHVCNKHLHFQNTTTVVSDFGNTHRKFTVPIIPEKKVNQLIFSKYKNNGCSFPFKMFSHDRLKLQPINYHNTFHGKQSYGRFTSMKFKQESKVKLNSFGVKHFHGQVSFKPKLTFNNGRSNKGYPMNGQNLVRFHSKVKMNKTSANCHHNVNMKQQMGVINSREYSKPVVPSEPAYNVKTTPQHAIEPSTPVVKCRVDPMHLCDANNVPEIQLFSSFETYTQACAKYYCTMLLAKRIEFLFSGLSKAVKLTYRPTKHTSVAFITKQLRETIIMWCSRLNTVIPKRLPFITDKEFQNLENLKMVFTQPRPENVSKCKEQQMQNRISGTDENENKLDLVEGSEVKAATDALNNNKSATLPAVRTSSRLKRDSRLPNRYDADYLVDIPSVKKIKRSRTYFHYTNPQLWEFYNSTKLTERKSCIQLTSKYSEMLEKHDGFSKPNHSSVISNEILDCMVNICSVNEETSNVTEQGQNETCEYCGLLLQGFCKSEMEKHRKRHKSSKPWSILKVTQHTLPPSKKNTTKKTDLEICKTTSNTQKQERTLLEKNIETQFLHKTSKPIAATSTIPPLHHFTNPYKRATARKSRPGLY